MKVPRSLLRFPFVLRDGTWEIFAPKGDLGRELGTRLCMHLADAYAVQKETLEETSGEEREDGSYLPFIASIMGIARPDGELQMTLATWSSEVHAYLPRAMVLAVGHIGGDLAMVPWEDAMELAGDHLQRVEGIYPTRWETKGFPDEATFTKLRSRAIDLEKRRETKSASRSQSRARQIAGAALADAPPAPSSSRSVMAIAVLVLLAIAVAYFLARS